MSETDNIGNFGEYSPIPTEPINHPVLKDLYERIADLESQRDSWKQDYDIMKQRWVQGLAAIDAIKSNVKEAILEAVNEDEIGKTKAREIFEACEIEATKTVTISGSISFSGEVEVSIFDEDVLDDVRYNLSTNNLEVEFNGEYLSGLDYDVEEAEWQE